MRKIIVSILLLLALSIVSFASDSIKSGTPHVDGLVDEIYLESYKIEVSGKNNTFHTSKGSTLEGSHGDSATAYFLYDDTRLYACISVKDDALYSRGEEWIVKNIKELSWENDAVELRVYYSELGAPKQANQYIFQCDAYGIASVNYRGMCKEEFISSTAITPDGYTVEFAVPLSFDKKAGDEIGLSIEVDDLHEEIKDPKSKVGGHKFNAYGSQHPYKNMVTLGTERAEAEETVFSDTKNHWSKSDVSYVVQKSLISAKGGYFDPDAYMTRAMFAAVLGRIYESKTGALEKYENAPVFTDVDYRLWYGKYVKWASGAGVINGRGNSRFDPDALVTREEMAVMLFRFAKAVPVDKKAEFSDFDEISSWAKDAVAYCAANGYINGDNNKCILPKAYATRAEVSALAARYMKATVKVYKG